MKLLIIGAGGREHALAWKLAQSERVEKIVVAPGNGGTDAAQNQDPHQPGAGKIENLESKFQKPHDLAKFAREAGIELTVVGPELHLAVGIVDTFQAMGLKIWGPTQSAARLESSKAFSKAFMERHKIPTAHAAIFTNFDQARDYLHGQTEPVVIKASGLAAGKGVLIPDPDNFLAEGEAALHQIMVEKKFGMAGAEVLIETRLYGPEVSVLAFCDGQTVIPMPPAQDHKRAFDHDQGPNTGGMGAYAPAPICPPSLLKQIVHTAIQPTVDGMHAEGKPYVGTLYAGVILTASGPQILEYNCRLGDPEAQVILPLLETDLLDILEYSVEGKLAETHATWSEDAAATVVLASGGYPGDYDIDKEITGLAAAAAIPGVTVFHAGTKVEDGRLLTGGGRVLNVTAVGADFAAALDKAYAAAAKIHFDGMHYRTDIGAKAKSQ